MRRTCSSRPLAFALVAAVATTTLLASPGRAAVTLPVRGQPTTIAMGAAHSVLIAADGGVWGTGRNNFGQLTGTGDRTALARLTGLPAGVRAKAVAAGGWDTLVLGSDGLVYGTGANSNNELTGAGARSTLTPLGGLPNGVKATAVSTSGSTVVVVGDDGIAYGAGRNDAGQLTGAGPGNTSSLTAMPMAVAVVAAAAGTEHTLLLGANGVVYGSGREVTGRLCTATTANRTTLQPLSGLPAGVTATAVAVSYQTTLLVGSNGVAYGCGYNGNSQLTSATPAGGTATTPTAMAGLPGSVSAKGVAATTYNSLVLGSNGVAYGAGSNGGNMLTGASTGDKPTLTPLSPAGAIGSLAEAALGDSDSMVRDTDGVVYGAGRNDYGQLTGAGTDNRQALTAFESQPLADATAPTNTGPAKVGGRLIATPGEWSPTPASFSYQWLRSGTPIPGATSSTYGVAPADLGTSLSVTVTAARTGFAGGSATSAATGSVARGAKLAWSPHKKPIIKVKGGGKAKVAKKLRIKGLKKTRWSPDATSFDYRWTRNGKAIKHATKSTYTVKGKDRGKKIRVVISAKRAGYTTGKLTLHKKKVSR